MAIKAIQSANVYIQYDDAVYELMDQYQGPSGHFVIKKISDQVEYCRIYDDGIIRWNVNASPWVTAVGMHLKITLP